MTVGEIIGTS